MTDPIAAPSPKRPRMHKENPPLLQISAPTTTTMTTTTTTISTVPPASPIIVPQHLPIPVQQQQALPMSHITTELSHYFTYKQQLVSFFTSSDMPMHLRHVTEFVITSRMPIAQLNLQQRQHFTISVAGDFQQNWRNFFNSFAEIGECGIVQLPNSTKCVYFVPCEKLRSFPKAAVRAQPTLYSQDVYYD